MYRIRKIEQYNNKIKEVVVPLKVKTIIDTNYYYQTFFSIIE